jgi:hypothetical protein
MYPKKIEKEEIPRLRLTSYEVLNDVVLIKGREQALQSAAILGNTEKQKCKIVFNTEEGSCAVETTIWAVTDKYVCLKGGLTLLIASIIDVII